MAALTYKCPNCDGGLTYDPDSGKYSCEYCMSSFSENEISTGQEAGANPPVKTFYEEKIPAGEESSAFYSCPSCGAQIVTEATTAASYCYYCHNPVVMSGRLEGRLRPDKIIPFSIGRERAVNDFLNWAKKKKFIPRAFFIKKQIEMITGVYFPYWLYDCDVRGRLDAKATKVRTWRSGNYRHTETSNYRILREGDIHFSDIIINALRGADKKLSEGVLPYDLDKLQDFRMPFLSGFQAQNRDIDFSELEDEVENQVRGYTEKLLRDTATGYTSISAAEISAEKKSGTWRCALLPAWILTYIDRNKKTYYYAMNGQTGKVCGILPLDIKRLLLLFIAVAIPLWILLMLGGYLL